MVSCQHGGSGGAPRRLVGRASTRRARGVACTQHPRSLPSSLPGLRAELQDNVKNIPPREAMDLLVEELGGPPEEIFRDFCWWPEGSASLGQVRNEPP